jgi:hypothetical protein
MVNEEGRTEHHGHGNGISIAESPVEKGGFRTGKMIIPVNKAQTAATV